jgi:hypothetical protein
MRVAVLLACALAPSIVFAQAVPKVGNCPTNFHASGEACVPNATLRDPPPVLPTVGACPTGYRVSGDYCLGLAGTRQAFQRTGSCPTGYHASGAYCLSNR